MDPPEPTANQPGASQIAQERLLPGPLETPFLGGLALLGLLVLLLASYAGLQTHSAQAGESAAAANPGSLYFPLGLHAARLASAAFAAAAACATALAARRLFHSWPVGLMAGALVGLDPGVLAQGALATPDALALAACLAALAAFLSPTSAWHWIGAGLLALGGLCDPRTILWGAALGLCVVLRGHIYAAPRHFGTAALQTVAAPAAGILLNLLAGPSGIAFLPCDQGAAASLAMAAVPGYGRSAIVHDPIAWFGGLGALLLMTAGAAWPALRQARMARLPGRIQLRLPSHLTPLHARILWLALFTLAAPFAGAWLPLFAIALAAGVGELSEDAPGFGMAVGFVVLAFAAIALARAWPAVTGHDAAAGVASIVPWARITACG